MNRLPPAQGFTLIELLIAVAVFAVMGAMAYGGLNAVLNTQEQARAQSERLRTLQLSMRILERDFSLAVNRQMRDLLGDPEQPLHSGSDPLVSLVQTGGYGAPGQTRSNLQRVAYRLENGVVYRLTWPTLDGAGAADAIRTRLLEQVERFEFRFLDSDNEWVTNWPTPEQLAAQSAAAVAPPAQPVPAGRRGAPGGAPAVPGAPGAAEDPAQSADDLPKAVELSLDIAHYGHIRRVFALPN